MDTYVFLAGLGAAALFAVCIASAGGYHRRRSKTPGCPVSHPPLGHYGPDGLPDVSTGWHIFADGNMWCAVGPAFENLQESPAGFGPTPNAARMDLIRAAGREAAKQYPDLAIAWANMQIPPKLGEFHIHYPTVKPDARTR
jgi:hypothetical protein